MILKKPYALLIKNFRTIHILLTALTIYIAYKSSSIIDFLREFILNNYSVTVTDNLVSNTIGGFLYLGVLLTIGILIVVYVLLKSKNKPVKTYFFTIVYYIIFLVFLVIASTLIGSLEDGLWKASDARTYRDFAQLIYYPQYIFIAILAVRSLGFNVKQFNFKNDIKELEITDKDSEEIELSINFETYKAERKVRRFIRESKYYFLENKLMFIIIGIVLVVLSGYNIFKNVEKVKYTYKENTAFTYNGMNITIEDSLLTNIDLNGNELYKDKYFVLIKLKIKNGVREDKKLDYTNFKLYYGSDYVYPVLDLGNYFFDFGDPFMNDTIKAGEVATYIIPYMIDAKYKDRNFSIVLYLGSSSKSEEFLAKTANIKLNPSKSGKVESVRTAKMGEVVSFSSTLLKDATFSVKSAEFTTRYNYTYEACYGGLCRNYNDVVVADNTYQNRQALVVMDYEMTLDSSTDAYLNISDINAFASSFMQIEYKKYGESKIVHAKYQTPTKVKDKLILQTDGNIIDADEINLLITIRDRRYEIKLK